VALVAIHSDCVAEGYLLMPMKQPASLRHVVDVGRRADDAVRQLQAGVRRLTNR
jgi:hypothetical protein